MFNIPSSVRNAQVRQETLDMRHVQGAAREAIIRIAFARWCKGEIDDQGLVDVLGTCGLCDPDPAKGWYIESEPPQWLHVYFADGSILAVYNTGETDWFDAPLTAQ